MRYNPNQHYKQLWEKRRKKHLYKEGNTNKKQYKQNRLSYQKSH